MRPGGPLSVGLLVVAAAVLCCAGPTLLILVAAGLGAAVLHSGASVAVGACLAAAVGIGSLVWWRRRSCARRAVPALQGPHEPPR